MRHSNLAASGDERDELRERRQRAAFGCWLVLAAGWSVLLAGLVLAATRWLLTH